jgi:hypothetical protein
MIRILLVLLSLITVSPLSAQPLFYQGKTVQIASALPPVVLSMCGRG